MAKGPLTKKQLDHLEAIVRVAATNLGHLRAGVSEHRSGLVDVVNDDFEGLADLGLEFGLGDGLCLFHEAVPAELWPQPEIRADLVGFSDDI